MKTFGENIKKFRLEKGLSLEELSMKSGISKKYLEKIEKGEAPGLNTSHIFKIVNLIRVSPHIFWGKL